MREQTTFFLNNWKKVNAYFIFFLLQPSYGRQKCLLVLCICRVVFIPLLMLCNAQPRTTDDVVFQSDIYPIVFIVLLGLTNGHLSTLAMMYGSRYV